MIPYFMHEQQFPPAAAPHIPNVDHIYNVHKLVGFRPGLGAIFF
jgi:hypothetical protein